ncbi:hypothetical protein [Gimesia maris]|uniref:hypothetical protein n=1 Tax=Gimesia maris TaxID=122 RepID=UPI0032EE981F
MRRPDIRTSVSAEFKQAIQDWCRDHDKEASAETRRMWAERIGRPEFANEKKMGRPRIDD